MGQSTTYNTVDTYEQKSYLDYYPGGLYPLLHQYVDVRNNERQPFSYIVFV
jgi:hypothetical protein